MKLSAPQKSLHAPKERHFPSFPSRMFNTNEFPRAFKKVKSAAAEKCCMLKKKNIQNNKNIHLDNFLRSVKMGTAAFLTEEPRHR